MGRGPTEKYYKDMMDGYVKGTLTCLDEEFIKENISTDFPLVINLEPTNACNLLCNICPRKLAINSGKKNLGYMDFDLYKRLIDEMANHKKLKILTFHKDGESLLHPKICEMIRYAKDKDVSETLHINTNVTTLNNDEDIAKFLKSGIDDVTISIDASRPSTYKKIKGVDLLEKVEQNVHRMLELRLVLGLDAPFIRVKIMEYDEITREEIEEFIEKWTGIADMVQVTGVHSWSGSIDVRITDETKTHRYPCALLWYTLAINWDGIVSACNVDWDLTAAVGDANIDTIHDIWNGGVIKKIRRLNLTERYGEVPVCNECVVWSSCSNLKELFLSKEEFYK